MSDPDRKPLHTQLKETLQPQATKSAFQKQNESITSAYDRQAANMQPDAQKGYFQRIADAIKLSHRQQQIATRPTTTTITQPAAVATENAGTGSVGTTGFNNANSGNLFVSDIDTSNRDTNAPPVVSGGDYIYRSPSENTTADSEGVSNDLYTKEHKARHIPGKSVGHVAGHTVAQGAGQMSRCTAGHPPSRTTTHHPFHTKGHGTVIPGVGISTPASSRRMS